MIMADELLLTPEEMAEVYQTKAGPTIIDATGYSNWYYEKAFCEAQLAKAKPIIEKAERERILDRIIAYLEERKYRSFVPSMITWVQALKEGKWWKGQP